MKTTDTISDIEQRIRPILRKYGITSASLVGSVSRGEENVLSDIDLIVEIKNPIGLLTFARIKAELESVLDKKVDLLERSALKPRIKKHLLEDEILLKI